MTALQKRIIAVLFAMLMIMSMGASAAAPGNSAATSDVSGADLGPMDTRFEDPDDESAPDPNEETDDETDGSGTEDEEAHGENESDAENKSDEQDGSDDAEGENSTEDSDTESDEARETTDEESNGDTDDVAGRADEKDSADSESTNESEIDGDSVGGDDGTDGESDADGPQAGDEAGGQNQSEVNQTMLTTNNNHIFSVSFMNRVDNDDDDRYSNFDVEVYADGDIDTSFLRSPDPYLVVLADGSTLVTKDIPTESNNYIINIQKSWLESTLDGDWVTMTVELRDRRLGAEDEIYDSRSRSIRYETPSNDLTTRDRGLIGIESLQQPYKQTSDQLSRDYWASAQAGSVEDSFEAMFPTVPEGRTEAQKDAAIALLDEKVTGGLAGDLTTIPAVADSVGNSLEEGKIANTLGKASSSTESNFYTSLGQLEDNTDSIATSSSPSDAKLETRLDLIEKTYERSIAYESEVRNSLTDRQDFFPELIIELFGADEDSFNTVQGYFEQHQQSLRADYYYTQLALNPNRAPEPLDKNADGDTPTYPTAEVTSFAVPNKATVGEPVTVSMTATTVNKDTPSQTITLSFPDDDRIEDVSISQSGLSDVQRYQNDQLFTVYGEQQETIRYPVVEAVGTMDEGETNTLEVTFTPTQTGEISIQAKSIAWASNERGTLNPDPGWGDKDDTDVVRDGQDELSYQEIMTVEERALPDADAGGPYQLSEGGSTELDSSGSSAPDSNIVDVEWTLEDGPGSINGNTYLAPASISSDTTATVSVAVTDENGATDTDTASIDISDNNQPPTADAGGSYSVSEGGSVNLDASGSNDPDGNIQDRSWTVISGPGGISGGTYQAPDDINRNIDAKVQLTVTDDDEASGTDTATVSVEAARAAPTASDIDISASEDSPVSETFSASDPDGDSLSYTIESTPSDGTVSVSGDSFTYTPESISSGTDSFVYRVNDGNGGTDTATVTIDISASEEQNQPPEVTLDVNPASAEVDQSVTFDGTGTSDPDGSITEYRWDFDGDGTIDRSTSTETVTYAYSEAGAYDPELTVVDDDSATSSSTATTTVTIESSSEPTPEPTEQIYANSFESSASGSTPDNWVAHGNSAIRVTDSVATDGSKSLRLSGSSGGCWETVGFSDIGQDTIPDSTDTPDTDAVNISFDVRPMGNADPGCHDLRNSRFRLDTGNGAVYGSSDQNLMEFRSNSNVVGTAGQNQELGSYAVGKWTDVTIQYERSQNQNITLTYYVDGERRGQVVKNEPSFANELRYLEVGTGEYTTYLDNISITTSETAARTDTQTGSPTVSADGDTAESGEEATVEVTIENGQTTAISGVPAGWSVAGYEDSSGTFNNQIDNEGMVAWAWSSGNQDAKSVSVTFDIPSNATTTTVDVVAENVGGNTAETGATVTVESTEQSVITGEVLDTENNRILGATVTVEDAFGSVVTETTTDSSGRYSVLVPPGEYTIIAESNSSTIEQTVLVEPGATTNADIVIQATESEGGSPSVTVSNAPDRIGPNGTFVIEYELENTGTDTGSFSLDVPAPASGVTVQNIGGDIKASDTGAEPASASTDAVEPDGGTVTFSVTYDANDLPTEEITAELTARQPLNSASDSALSTITVTESTVPTDPTERALQITGKEDPSELTQDDVTVVITRFNRGQSVNNIEIEQDDVTVTITLFERS